MIKVFTFIIFLLSINIAFSQNVIWSEDFANGIPATWQNYDPNDPTAVWDWSDNPSSLTWGGPPFAGTTASNGFAVFDSDLHGSVPHDVRLQTNAIDCSALSTVYVYFENQYAYFNAPSIAQLGVSTDSINFTYYNLFSNIPAQDLKSPIQFEEIDISAQAANQSTVYLQFRWVAEFEYAWKIDDIRVQDAPTPPAQHNTAILAYNIAPNYGTPLVYADTMEFAALVSNEGLVDETNVKIEVKIIETSEFNTLQYIDSLVIDTLLVGGDSLVSITTTFLPTDTGTYRLTYQVSQDSADQFRFDNQRSAEFKITEKIFAKDNGQLLVGIRPSTQGDYRIGNLYETQEERLKAIQVQFAATSGSTPIAGEQATILLYEVDSTILPDFSNFDINSDNDLTIVASAVYNFGLGEDYDSIIVNLFDFNTGDTGVYLKPNTQYFVAVSYAGASNDLYAVISESLVYDFDIHTVVFAQGQWFLLGFQNAYEIAFIRLILGDSLSTKTQAVQSLPQEAIKISPNPARNQISVDISLEKTANIQIIVSDITGKQLQDIKADNILNKQLFLNVDVLTDGIYNLTLKTPLGSLTKQFIIHK